MADLASPRGGSSSDVSVDELNASIRQQVNAAVSRFAQVLVSEEEEEESELLRPAELEARQSELERLEEEKKSYDEQLKRLQEEVELMEDEMRRREEGTGEVVADKDMERALFGIARSRKEEGEERESVATSKEHEKSVRNLKARIKLNEAFNGIRFTSAEWEIVKKERNSLVRKHTHVGAARDFHFRVEFLVKEINMVTDGANKEDRETPSVVTRIIALSVSVDPTAEDELQTFISRVCVDYDLMKFYQTYVKYAILVNERREAFAAVKSQYGGSVKVPHGLEGTRLSYRMSSGVSLFFSWTVTVSERGFVASSLGLQVKSHSEVSEEDRDVMGHLPHLLQKMVSTQGYRMALLSILSILQPS